MRDLTIACSISSLPAILLHKLDPQVVSFVFPPTVAIVSFFFMATPWLDQKNIMVVVMYVIVAEYSSLNLSPSGPNFALGLAGSIMIGCLIGLLSKIFPLPRPESALHQVRLLLDDYRYYTDMFFHALIEALNSIDVSTSDARQAISRLEMAADMLGQVSGALLQKKEMAEFECKILLMRSVYHPESLSRCIEFLNLEHKKVNQIRAGLSGPVLGEELSALNSNLKRANCILSEGLHNKRNIFYECLGEGIEKCISIPGIMRSSRNNISKHEMADRVRALKDETIDSFNPLLADAEKILYESHVASGGKATPPFSYFVRRLQTLFGVLAYAEGLAKFLELDETSNENKMSENVFVSTKKFLLQRWEQFSFEAYRLPIKVGLGLSVASLWIVVPSLAQRSKPFSFWPGVTVAVVNLPTPGSSYVKCIHRLWGTLAASCFALLLVFFVGDDEFNSNYNTIKLSAISVFTFLATYMHQKESSYAYIYGIVSIGSILFGSIKNNYYVEGYVTQRMMLIVTGMCIFVAFELLIYPKSSRLIMGKQVLDFMTTMKLFVLSTQSAMADVNFLDPDSRGQDTLNILLVTKDKGAEHNESKSLKVLRTIEVELQAHIAKANTHLPSAMSEPDLGFTPLSDTGFFGVMVQLQNHVLESVAILVFAIERMQNQYIFALPREHAFRKLAMPKKCAEMIGFVSDQINSSCLSLSAAFPDGQIGSPIARECILSLQAAASFRSFEDVQLAILAEWSKAYHSFVQSKMGHVSVNSGYDGSQLHQRELLDSISLLMMVRLATALSSVLEICRNLQLMGRHLERIARSLPDERKQI